MSNNFIKVGTDFEKHERLIEDQTGMILELGEDCYLLKKMENIDGANVDVTLTIYDLVTKEQYQRLKKLDENVKNEIAAIANHLEKTESPNMIPHEYSRYIKKLLENLYR